MRRGIGVGIAIGIAALALSGCVTFKGEIKGKQVSEKKVQVKFKVCTGADGECETPKPRARGVSDARLLIGFRVPKGTGVPESFRPIGSDERLKRNASYKSQLNQLAPKREGQKWFGFASTPLEKEDLVVGKVKVRFRLPDDIGNVFKHRPVVGVASTEPGDPVVECGDNPYKAENSDDRCITDPTSAATTRRSLRIKLD